ncbi:MAG: glycosyltransferase family 1 protein, partial [Gemmatimonadaceae bacterium]|nr:glycosyltransferase family 1 protein [Gemmatimonadaceae bacterium]
LARGIARLLDDPSEAARLGAHGSLRSLDYAWDNIIDELERLYESAAGVPPREPAAWAAV